MPIYEFKCKSCSKEFELLARSGCNEAVCPECGGNDCMRLLSVFGFSSSGKFTSSTGGAECSGCSKSSCKGCK